jgi:RNA polymerase sigma-70 factor (ECF subfamily)
MDRDPIPAGQEGDLLAQVGWIRELAGHMVADSHRAADLAQETYVVGLEAPPRNMLSIRVWLRTVMRNLLRQGARGDLRRRAREALVSRAERTDATDELLERAEMQRRIVEAVLGLEEPYRSTILWRFFEDEPPRDIAKRLGLPVTTVQSRLKRGLQRLRERLEDSRRDAGAWLALFVPLSARNSGPLALTTGGLIVNAKLTLAVVSIVVLATGIGITRFLGADEKAIAPAPEIPIDSRPEAPKSHELPLETSGATLEPARIPVDESSVAVGAAPDATPEALHRVRGHVLDADSNPVGGFALMFEDDRERIETRSSAGGAFEVLTRATSGTVTSNEKTIATVRKGLFRAGSSFEPVVIVAPAITVGGSVLDPDRTPVQGARVSLALPNGFETRFGQILESTRVLRWTTLSDAQGRFVLADLPQVAGSSIRVLVDGYKSAAQPEPEFSDPNLCFVLERPGGARRGALRGRVVDPEGRGVDRARVAAGLTSTVTDGEGQFVLDLSRAVTAERVTAVKAGLRPASLERPDLPEGDRTGWPDFVELRLGGPALAIRGHVVDPKGEPRAGMRVWIGDPSPFGLIGKMPIQNEGLMAGAVLLPRALEEYPTSPQGDGNNVDIHRAVGAPPSASWYWVTTGGDGGFELTGLDDRNYKLRVLDPKTLQAFTSDPIAAGDPRARIVMPAPSVFPKLAGRVITVGNRPVAGVRLVLRTTSFEVSTRYYGGKLTS